MPRTSERTPTASPLSSSASTTSELDGVMEYVRRLKKSHRALQAEVRELRKQTSKNYSLLIDTSHYVYHRVHVDDQLGKLCESIPLLKDKVREIETKLKSRDLGGHPQDAVQRRIGLQKELQKQKRMLERLQRKRKVLRVEQRHLNEQSEELAAMFLKFIREPDEETAS